MTGAVPGTSGFRGCVALDAKGFIKTGPDLSPEDLAAAHWPLARVPHLLETSLPGVFAVGDVRGGNIKRVASAVGEGSIAISFVHQALPDRRKLMMAEATCAHIEAVATVKHAKHRQCDECVKIGADWVHLRICQECGATHCCDDSPNRHATKHARASKHPVIASAEPGERWLYCYPDDAVAEY